jgi:hypothetical protein
VLGSLRAGEQLDGLARVRGSNWILVGRNGHGHRLRVGVGGPRRRPGDPDLRLGEHGRAVGLDRRASAA